MGKWVGFSKIPEIEISSKRYFSESGRKKKKTSRDREPRFGIVSFPCRDLRCSAQVRAQGQTIRKAGVARGELLAIARVLMSGLLNLNQIRQLRREVRPAALTRAGTERYS